MKSISIVNYAINGLGLGHLTRLIAINREVRRICAVLDIQAEIVFLTSSEADSLCYQHGFASFKIPSKSVVRATDLQPTRYRKIAKQWMWNAINLLSPDILVVDTIPYGSFNELYDVLDFGQKNVFVYRAVREEIANSAQFASALHGYHSIIAVNEFGESQHIVPDEVMDRVHDVNPIIIRSSQEILTKEEARKQLSIGMDDTVVYCTFGGGGDTQAQAFFESISAFAAATPHYTFVVGAGSLFTGSSFMAENIRWTTRHTMMELYNAFDVALCAGGFNTTWEMLHCGVPCVFVPQVRAFDNQEQRVQKVVEYNAGLVLSSLSQQELSEKIELVLSTRELYSTHAKQLAPYNAARAAARELLATRINSNLLDTAIELLNACTFSTNQSRELDILRTLRTFRKLQAKFVAIEDASNDDIILCTEAVLYHATKHNLPLTELLQRLWEFPEERASSLQYICQRTISTMFLDETA